MSKPSKKTHAKTVSTVEAPASASTSTSTATPAPSPEVSATPLPTPPGDMPPAIGAPAPRAGWEPTKKKKRGTRGPRPRGAQINNAPAAAKEITQSTTYVEDFGTHAPAAQEVSFVITNAAKWRDTWAGAKKFFVYASEQRAAWEAEAQAQMDALKPAFEYVTTRDPAVAKKYAATSKYLGAAKAIAARGVATRKQKAALKAKEAGVNAPVAPPAVAPVAKA